MTGCLARSAAAGMACLRPSETSQSPHVLINGLTLVDRLRCVARTVDLDTALRGLLMSPWLDLPQKINRCEAENWRSGGGVDKAGRQHDTRQISAGVAVVSSLYQSCVNGHSQKSTLIEPELARMPKKGRVVSSSAWSKLPGPTVDG